MQRGSMSPGMRHGADLCLRGNACETVWVWAGAWVRCARKASSQQAQES